MVLARYGALVCASLIGMTIPAGGRAGEYVLEPGDVLSFMVVGAPELGRAIPVEIDGTAWFPIVGEVQVASSPLREVRRRVAQAYSTTSVTPAVGGDAPALVQPAQVYVGIEQYRPIYLAGDLLQSRTIEYRPGLTLRQALVLASSGAPSDTGEGGPGAVRERIDAALVETSRAYARIWSLKRLLGTDTPQDRANIFVADIEAVQQIAELESGMIEAKLAEREQQKSVIEESILRAERRLAALEAQKTSEEEALRLDEQIAAEVRELFVGRSPLAPASRFAEVRRSALAGASRVLQLDVAAENVRTELAGLRADAAAVEVGAQSETWSELADALTIVQKTRAELAALRSASVGLPQDRVVAVITRAGSALPPVAADDSDQELQPGDIVEIVRAGPENPEG